MASKLQNRVERDYKDIMRMVNGLYLLRTNDIGEVLDETFDVVLKSIAMHLAFIHKISYVELNRLGVFKRIEHDVSTTFQTAAQRLEDIGAAFGREMNLLGRLASGFIARKSTPPWIDVRLNIKSMDGGLGPRKGLFLYYMDLMSKDVMTQVQRGALNEETSSQILKRVRGLFKVPKKKRRAAEADFKPMTDEEARMTNYAYDMTTDTVGFADQIGKTPVSVEEGFYTIDDVDNLQDSLRQAQSWRQYRPWFSDDLKAQNRLLSQMESNFMSDMVTLMNEGALQVGSESMGIKDFVWRTKGRGLKGPCDYCKDRDGLTMSEIKKTIKDKYGDQVPRIHPSCYCELVPEISDDWMKSEAEKNGYEWDSGEGMAFHPTEKQRALGFKDMSFDEWMDTVGGNRG